MGSSPLDAWIANDEEITSLLARDWDRQTTTVQLIASENFASPSVLAATGSILTNKYAEGYPGRRYYGGNYIVDEVEEKMREAGYKPARREGTREGRWTLLDYVDIVVHIQHQDERDFYSLDRLWRDCPMVPVDLSEDPGNSASQP